jgi:hypothetical protein
VAGQNYRKNCCRAEHCAEDVAPGWKVWGHSD